MSSGWLHKLSVWFWPQTKLTSEVHHPAPEPRALPIESWEQVLADVDDETAALILKLEIDDMEHHSCADNKLTSPDFRCAQALWRRELKHYRAVRVPGVPTDIPPGVVAFECIICQDRFVADDGWLVPCEHFYCVDCLNDLFRTAMTDEQAYPPRCCQTEVEFDETVRLVLDEDIAHAFAAKEPELKDPKPTYCHISTCSTYISDQLKEDGVANCPSCTAKT